MTNQIAKILTHKETVTMTTLSKATIQRHIHLGIFPQPISMGSRRVAFLFDEVQSLLRFRIAGKSDQDIKTLIIKMKEDREK